MIKYCYDNQKNGKIIVEKLNFTDKGELTFYDHILINVYQLVLYFDKLYDKMTDREKKEFVKSFVEEVHLYEKEQEDGRFLKHIKLKFPVFFNGTETEELDWDNESTVECVVLMSRVKERYVESQLALALRPSK